MLMTDQNIPTHAICPKIYHLFTMLIASTFLLPISSFQIPTERRINNNIGRFHPIADDHTLSQRRQQLGFRTSSGYLSSKYQSSPRSSLFSLHRLVEELKTYNDNSKAKSPRVIFVGGKGGVGKTTISSALAVSLASDFESDQKILIVSTDPAHSLGDALDADLRAGHGKVMPMTDPVTGGRLFACEVDPEAALDEFRANLAAFDVDRLADALGVSPTFLDSLGLREFNGLLNNPPPGLDELVALANVLDSSGKYSLTKEYDVVIVDTAPTGHTMRLLALPAFLDGFLGKLIELRMKLSGLTSTLQSLFGSEQATQRAKAIDDAAEKLDIFRTKMSGLREKLQDDQQTSFMVVTVPTKLGVAESKRLIKELTSQGVAVTDVVVNQCVGDLMDADSESNSHEALVKYYERRRAGQKRWISELRGSIEEVSGSEEFRANGDPAPIALTEVPFFDVELVGVPALAYVARSCLNDNPSFSHLMESSDEEAKFVICGGKGGVGKTTTSSALAVAMAGAGHNVALVSTDPAHSLGDALDINLSGGSLIDCPLIGMPPSDGSLSVMEVDPSSALKQFKTLVDDLIGSSTGKVNSDTSGLGSALRDLGEVFDTLPAGTDEVVALAKVVGLLKNGNYDRIVLDTAPTGHTLRMLSTPGFLAELIDRVLMIAQRVNSNAAVKMLITSRARGEGLESAGESAKSALLSFQMQMYDLEDLFSNARQTEFLIVSVPTELAVRESVRLLNDLTFDAPDMPIKVRNVVVNQILSDDGSDVENFLSRVGSGQAESIQELKKATEGLENVPEVTKVSYLDTEPRGVFGLKALERELLDE